MKPLQTAYAIGQKLATATFQKHAIDAKTIGALKRVGLGVLLGGGTGAAIGAATGDTKEKSMARALQGGIVGMTAGNTLLGSLGHGGQMSIDALYAKRMQKELDDMAQLRTAVQDFPHTIPEEYRGLIKHIPVPSEAETETLLRRALDPVHAEAARKVLPTLNSERMQKIDANIGAIYQPTQDGLDAAVKTVLDAIQADDTDE